MNSLKEKLTKIVKNVVKKEKILQEEFSGLADFFKVLNIQNNQDYLEVYNNHLIDAIVTSLIMYVNKNPDIIIEETASDEYITDLIKKAIKVAKETFAYSINQFNNDI